MLQRNTPRFALYLHMLPVTTSRLAMEATFAWLEFQVDDYTCLNSLKTHILHFVLLLQFFI